MSMQIADNFSYQGTKPLDARVKFATVADMVAVADSSLYDGCMAYVTATKLYYTYDSTNTVDATFGKWREYKSGSGHTVKDGDGVSMTEQPNLQFKGMSVSNDNQNNATVVDGSGKAKSTAVAPVFDATEAYAEGDRVMYEDELYVFNKAHTGAWDSADADKSDVDSEIPDKLTSQQMQEIKDAFSGMNKGAPLRMMHYSTEEQVVGTWIDGKPVYQKTVYISSFPNNADSTYPHGISNIDVVLNVFGFAVNSSMFFNLPYVEPSVESKWYISLNSDRTNIKIKTGSDRSTLSGYVTLQYTKTID